jgi:hypothetical protein
MHFKSHRVFRGEQRVYAVGEHAQHTLFLPGSNRTLPAVYILHASRTDD